MVVRELAGQYLQNSAPLHSRAELGIFVTVISFRVAVIYCMHHIVVVPATRYAEESSRGPTLFVLPIHWYIVLYSLTNQYTNIFHTSHTK